LVLDGVTAKGVLSKLNSKNGKRVVSDLTPIMQMYRGRFQMEPLQNVNADRKVPDIPVEYMPFHQGSMQT
jgi:hypothetical protein